MTDDTEFRRALDIFKDQKERAVRREGIGADLPPMLELRREGTLLALAFLDGERDRVRSLLRRLVMSSDADRAVFVVDAYGWATGADGAPPDLELGELARRFGAGDQAVYECLQLVLVGRDGHTSGLQARYSYEGRTVVWHDDEEPFEMVGGEMLACLRRGFVLQAQRPGPALPPDVVASTLGVALLIPAPGSPRSWPSNRRP